MDDSPETNPLREAVFPPRRNPFCFQKKLNRRGFRSCSAGLPGLLGL